MRPGDLSGNPTNRDLGEIEGCFSSMSLAEGAFCYGGVIFEA